MNSEDLAGLAEVADLLGVTRGTALRYSKRQDFPQPLGRLRSGPVWRTTDITTWAEEHLPLPEGRPPEHRPNADTDQ